MVGDGQSVNRARPGLIHGGSCNVYVNPMYRYWLGRIAWSLLRHPVKSHCLPARHERLITAEELRRFAT